MEALFLWEQHKAVVLMPNLESMDKKWKDGGLLNRLPVQR